MTAPAGFTQVWGDEFNSASLDLSHWTASGPNENTYGAEHWDVALVSLGNSYLHLQAMPDLRSGEIRGLAQWAPPVYVEFSAQLPHGGPGAWPGGWLVTAYDMTSQQSRQEIDIAECDSNLPNRIGENLHWGVSGAVQDSNGGYADSWIDYQSAFHTYSVLYTVATVDFYVDDVVRRHWPQQSPPLLFDPMKIRFSLSIFGTNQSTWARPPEATTQWPFDFLIDWVRVWQPSAPPTPPKRKHHK